MATPAIPGMAETGATVASKFNAIWWLLVLSTIGLSVSGPILWPRARRLIIGLLVVLIATWAWYAVVMQIARSRGLL